MIGAADIPTRFSSESEIFLTLSRHLELVPYISIFVDPSPISRQESDGLQQLELLGRLSNFYNLEVLRNRPQKMRKTPDFSSLSGYHRRIYHSLVFIERKIFGTRSRHYGESVALLKTLLDFLVAIPPNFTQIIVNVNEEKLYGCLRKDPPRVAALQSYYNFRFSLISRLTSTLQTEEANIFELKRIIEIMSLTINENSSSSFFPQHPLQVAFERVIMSPMLPYAGDINSIVDDFEGSTPEQFVSQVFDEVVHILDDLQFTEKRHDMALVLFLYRYIFDKVYEKNKYLHGQAKDIISQLHYMPLNKLQLPKEYCPTFDETQGAEFLFRNDPLFKKAVEALESSIYYVNPFDILHCVDEAITYIEAAASLYATNPISVFPFEVTFSLFLGVLLSTSLTNWSSIVSFVVKYTPQTGLDPKFEYARAKMEASKAECKKMLRNLRGVSYPNLIPPFENMHKVPLFVY